jgi:putative inorganic carbon (hco3(-)) transporter
MLVPPAAIGTRRVSLSEAAFYLAAGSAVAILVSIAVSQILLGLAVVVLLLSGARIRFPPVLLPLGLFMAGTLVSLLLSPDPASGRPQVRKFFVFLILMVVYSTVRTIPRVLGLLLIATGVLSFSALWSFVQFFGKWRQAVALGRPFYTYYTAERITGFMSHWMTVGGQEMIVVLLASALLLFSVQKRWKPWLAAGTVFILASILIGFTRSIWFGTFAGGAYLLWMWRRWWVLVLPLAVLPVIAANPFALRERVRSVFQPHGDTDSNEFRHVCRVTGVAMIKAHPWFGLGPEQVKAQFLNYIPAEVARPLPTGWYGHLHNIYLHYAAERGIPTALMLMWFLGKILYDFIRHVRRATGDARAILHGAIAVIIGVLLVGFFELNLGDSEVLTMFLVTVACGYVAVDCVRIPEESIADARPATRHHPVCP